ncbi:MAG: helix-turn-helix transcriptional regulator [Chloroflexota bacterium]
MTDERTVGDLDIDQVDDQVVGERLRDARETLGLTQADVAGALGIPRTSVLAMEAGRRKVTGLELRRLSRIYRRPIDWLLGGEPPTVDADDALFHATSALSADDKAQVLRFAQFLASAGSPGEVGGRAAGARRRRRAPDNTG